MIKYSFKNVSREIVAKIVEDAIKLLADKRNFDVFTLTLDVDCDESDIEVKKETK